MSREDKLKNGCLIYNVKPPILAILMLAAGLYAGCSNDNTSQTNSQNNLMVDSRQYTIIVIDSCEYVSYAVGMNHSMFSHKGNCKYCLIRKK
jgi:hypothetical protein